MLRLCFIVLILSSWEYTIAALSTSKTAPPRKIAIIGGGIGGTSASYFLRKRFGYSADIDVFEKNSRLCGRLATVRVGGREYESGGSIIHPRNKYMKTFVETLPGLEEASDYDGFFGIFDGTNYVFQSSTWSIVSLVKMLWKFGLSFLRIAFIEKQFLSDFERIYELQDRGMSYENTSALFHAMGGDKYKHVTQITSEQFFTNNKISDFTINNLVSPGIRNNYGQDARVNAFVGAVSMAGIEPGLWSVKHGNKEVCYKLVENSSATIIHEQVIVVRKVDGGKFSIVTSQSNGTERLYDIVILAAPVGDDMYHINVSEACQGPPPSFHGKDYRRTVANFVRGKLNSTLFQCDSVSSCPAGIFISNPDLFYRSIGYHVPVDYEATDTDPDGTYKVFSTEPLTKHQRDYLFESYTETATVEWKAYPKYRPPDIPGTFVLNEGFYYTSPIEWAASAMEMSVISANNAVLLAYNHWYKENRPTVESIAQKGEL